MGLEVWKELLVEFSLENVKPVSPDSECMKEIVRMLTDISQHVKTVQALLITADHDQILTEEDEFYKKIKESHTHEMKRYQEFTNYVERTSNLNVLQKTRQIQLEAIERSRLISRGKHSLGTGEILHETIETRLRTTKFPGRNVQVMSTDKLDSTPQTNH